MHNIFTKGAAVKAAPKAEEKKKELLSKVKALRIGWFNNRRIEEGTEFWIPTSLVSKVWMEVIDVEVEDELK